MFLAVAGALTFTASIASAQDQPAAEGEATEQVQEAAPAEEAPAQLTAEDLLKGTGEDVPFHQQLKSYFIQGGPGFMSMILLCLIIGLALAIERILYLSFAKTNTKKLVKKVEDALAEGGVEKAKEVCRNTKGPVASIFYDGLLHYDEGLDVVEKIQQAATDKYNRPLADVRILRATVISDPFAPKPQPAKAVSRHHGRYPRS